MLQSYLTEADELSDNGVYDNGRELKLEMARAFERALAWLQWKGPELAAGTTAQQQQLQRMAGACERGAKALAAWKEHGSAAGAAGFLDPDAALVGVQLLLGLLELPLSLVVLGEVDTSAQGACLGGAAAAPGIAVQVWPAPGVVQTSLDAAVQHGEPYELPPARTLTIIVAGGHARAVVLRRHVEVWYHGSEPGASAYEGGRLVPLGMARHKPAGGLWVQGRVGADGLCGQLIWFHMRGLALEQGRAVRCAADCGCVGLPDTNTVESRLFSWTGRHQHCREQTVQSAEHMCCDCALYRYVHCAGGDVPKPAPWQAASGKRNRSPSALSRVPSGVQLDAGAASPSLPPPAVQPCEYGQVTSGLAGCCSIRVCCSCGQQLAGFHLRCGCGSQ